MHTCVRVSVTCLHVIKSGGYFLERSSVRYFGTYYIAYARAPLINAHAEVSSKDIHVSPDVGLRLHLHL